ncbi:MAG: glutathione S-transferase [Myxococcales bacterium]|nr:glutathione S-transferase [Myxococcales bacterium]
MPSLRLYGTVTSPYVRRVRIVAHELGLGYALVDAATDAGQAAMRTVNPIWKVPTLELDGRPIFDSRVITEHLLRHHGPGPLDPHDPEDLERSNAREVIDGALDALINAFYLAKDGLSREASAYVAKQHERAASAMAWLEARAPALWPAGDARFGLAEIGLCTTLEWMRFRDTYPVDRHPALAGVLERHAGRPSLTSTHPTA